MSATVCHFRRLHATLFSTSAIVLALPHRFWAGQQRPTRLKTAKVGARAASTTSMLTSPDPAYIPRGGQRGAPATARRRRPANAWTHHGVRSRHDAPPVGEIPDTGGNGVAVDPKSGHGFRAAAVSMFDTKTLKLIKKIDVPARGRRRSRRAADGSSRQLKRPCVRLQPPTKDAMMIDSKDGTVVGRSISGACQSRRSPTARATCGP